MTNADFDCLDWPRRSYMLSVPDGEVIDALRAIAAPCRFNDVLAWIVTVRLRRKRLDGDTLLLSQRLDYPLREAVWRLISGGVVELTPRRCLALKEKQR